MNDILYWVWLQCCLGAENRRFKKIIEYFGSPYELSLVPVDKLKSYRVFTQRELDRIEERNFDQAGKILEDCEKYGITVIPFGSRRYPKRLAEIKSPPVVIYVKGSLPDQDRLHVAMVGTRNCTTLGSDNAYNLAVDLSKKGVVVISGGANGIDMQAHTGAVNSGGITICVLGCGIADPYLKNNKYLRNAATRNGALISEYPPVYPPSRITFPHRNRIISGLSDCTVVIEAGFGSGSLITARYCIESKKPLFSFLYDDISDVNAGCNMLLSEGAFRATDADSIIKVIKSGEIINTLPDRIGQIHMYGKKYKADPNSTYSKTKNHNTIKESDTEESFGAYGMSRNENDPVIDYSNIISSILINDGDTSVVRSNPASLDKRKGSFASYDKTPVRNKTTDKDNNKQQKKKKSPDVQNDKIAVKNSFNIVKTDKSKEKREKNKASDKKISEELLTENALSVYHTISETPIHIDDVKEHTGLTTNKTLAAVTELEMYGLIKNVGGRKYVRAV